MKNTKLSYVLNIILLLAIVILVVKTKMNAPDAKGTIENQAEFIDTTFEKTSLGAGPWLYVQPVLVVGSYDEKNVPNIMTVAWAGMISSGDSPRVMISITKGRYSYDNIIKNKAFTISIPSSRYLKEVDYVGNISGRDGDKFKATGLTPVKGEFVNAPYVKEFPLVMEVKVVAVENFTGESHDQIFGEIVDVKIDPDYQMEDENPDMGKINPLIFAIGEQGYYSTGKRVGQVGREWPKVKSEK